MNERNDIDHPIWRKKVDASFLNETVTPIPKWLWDVWKIKSIFQDVNSKKDIVSCVTIIFDKSTYAGNVTITRYSDGREFCRLSFASDLHNMIKERYLMTYMRSIEGQILKNQGYKGDIEQDIPFWEFIDIEFDVLNKVFIFTSHYSQKPIFPELFKQLITSPSIKKVDYELTSNDKERIYKQDWKPREQYKSEIGAENVIYTLADSQNKLIYIGEAQKLIPRFNNGHPDIKSWDFYKYNVLPSSLAQYRVMIERMTIRDLAAILDNKQSIDSLNISSYSLANRKIDLK